MAVSSGTDAVGARRGRVVVIGGGPAGLMAAEAAISQGVQVDVYDAMPSVGRKFLLAGKGGMNITHAEARERFEARYGLQTERIRSWLDVLDADALRAWVHGLGIETFIGTSGRVFPRQMKAGPLLRAWLHRLRESGVRFHVRHRWTGWCGDALRFTSPEGSVQAGGDAVVLALGGGSWPRLGSDGAWVPMLRSREIDVAPLRPANCGFERGWSNVMRDRHAGAAVKNVLAHVDGDHDVRPGEFIVADYGLEGGLIYALSRRLRERLEGGGEAALVVDLLPDWTVSTVRAALERQRSGRSLANRLRAVGLEGVKAALVRELLAPHILEDAHELAKATKTLRIAVSSPRPLDEAISSAGGVVLDELDERLMLMRMPGVFCAGEMLDWEAPTGGYLLTACFAGGLVAGRGAARWAASAAGADPSPAGG